MDGPAARGALGFDDGGDDGWMGVYIRFFGGFGGMIEKSWCGERWVGRQSWVYVSVIGDCSR